MTRQILLTRSTLKVRSRLGPVLNSPLSPTPTNCTHGPKSTPWYFSHQHFRDFFVLGGNPEKRLKYPLPIGINIQNVNLQLMTESFKVLHTALDNSMLLYIAR